MKDREIQRVKHIAFNFTYRVQTSAVPLVFHSHISYDYTFQLPPLHQIASYALITISTLFLSRCVFVCLFVYLSTH